MIVAFDTYYYREKAKTVGIVFNKWSDSTIQKSYSETIEIREPYRSGQFYKRELPCILHLIRKIPTANIECILIDGFVFLDDYMKPGLGAHLFNSLTNKIPVIGIAKTNSSTIHENRRLVYRGKSRKPLYITTIQYDLDKAAECIQLMSGTNRIPTLLKALDTLTRNCILKSTIVSENNDG